MITYDTEGIDFTSWEVVAMKFLLFVLGLGCLACSSGLAREASANKSPVIRQIDEAMKVHVRNRTISGAVTLVAREGELVHFGAVGLADIDRKIPMKRTSLFAIASMTKPVVATGLMILQDEGKLNIDDPIKKYIPAFANAKLVSGQPLAREITIRECLAHTSGITGEQIFAGSLASSVNQLAREPLAFQPRRRWEYGPGINVVGRIIEVVSRQSLDKFLRERIFKPLGMNDTTFFPSIDQVERIATLYKPGKYAGRLTPDYGFLGDFTRVTAPNPSGGLISHPRDMFRFYQMVLNRGMFRRQRIVSAAAVRQMLKPQTGNLQTGFTPGNSWGLGWCIVKQPQGVTEMLSKGSFGHGGAYGTQGWVDPKTKTIYVLMIQRSGMENSDDSIVRKTFQRVASEQLNFGRSLETALRTD